jgi:hypothetical protein
MTAGAVVGAPDGECPADPLQDHAAEVFTKQLSAIRVPSIRAIRAQLHVGQSRAAATGSPCRRIQQAQEKISRIASTRRLAVPQ